MAARPESVAVVNRIGETSPAHIVNYEQELRGAQMLMASGLLPETIKKPETALFLILVGRDLGLSPVQALRSIHIIKGKVEVSADQQLGLFHRAGGRSHWSKLTDTVAVLRLEAPWLIEPHEETFSMEDAKRAGLSGSQNYKSYPRAMLRSRAITAGLKSVGFDPTAGVYAYGELGGEVPTLVEDVPEVQPEAEVVDTTVDDAKEREAHAEIVALLPDLTAKQQDYVKEKLGDGADPVALLAHIHEKMPRGKG